ncbi:MAG: DUF1015 domain-containing protein [Acidimicrobiales bacterium]
MARFDAFRGIRYDLDTVQIDDVVAPPYDVVTARRRAELAARSPYSVVHVDQPEEARGDVAYTDAAATFRKWRDDGVLVTDAAPSMYIYRMDYRDDTGRSTRTIGVIGALEATPASAGAVLPHEQTTPKAKTDRLSLIRATKANLSPIWGLSPAAGLTSLLELDRPAAAQWQASDGAHHRLWAVDDPALLERISQSIAGAPVLIADGHHRFEVSLQYRREQREANGDRPGAYDSVMAFVVELAEEELSVLPIHRLIDGLPATFSPTDALDRYFTLAPITLDPTTIARQMAASGTLTLVTAAGAWSMTPRPDAMRDVRDLDSSRLDRALTSFPEHSLTFQHGVDHVVAAVRDGRAQAGVLLRPVPLAQIEAIAHGGERMPPKSTFFNPKPSTGAVFMSVE